MDDIDRLEQKVSMESRILRKRYFKLQSERHIKLPNPDDIVNYEDEEPFVDLPSPFDEGEEDFSDKELMQAEIQAMVEYYRLAFEAAKAGQYLIAALSIVEYFQKIFMLADTTTRDKVGNLFYEDKDDCLITWIGNRNELRDLIYKLESNDYVDELSGHKEILEYLDILNKATEALSFERSSN